MLNHDMSCHPKQLDQNTTTSLTRLSPEVYEPESYFVLRVPLLPVSVWIDGGQTRERASAALDTLHECWNNAGVREAIYLASRSLYQRLQSWKWRLETEKDRKLALSIYRYVARTCTRATPFGLFASISLGSVGDSTQLCLKGGATRLRRHTRLDTTTIAALCEQLSRDPSLSGRLRVRSNDCGHRIGDRWHYIDWRLERGVRQYTLASVSLSVHLECVLSLACQQDYSVAELINAVCKIDHEIDSSSAEEFIKELIESRVLVPLLEPLVTGEECLPSLIAELTASGASAGRISTLRSVRSKLEEIDQAGIGCAPEKYEVVAEIVSGLGVELDPSTLFHVDSYRDASGLQLSGKVLAEIARAAEISMALGPRRQGELDEFCRRFNERYEGRRIPLLEALDDEAGISADSLNPVPNALLDGIDWKRQAKEKRKNQAADSSIFGRWQWNLSNVPEEIVVEPGDIPNISEKLGAHLPASMYASATLVAASAADVDLGNYKILLHGVGGPSSANFLGRFCFGQPALADRVRESLAREAAAEPDAVYAEIVHLPQNRIGNVICRPLLRQYEIPLLGRSGAPVEKRIALEDLDVEVQGSTVLLWSRRLGKRVVPRMSNAHDFETNCLSIYSFLCRVQRQGRIVTGFSWSDSFSMLSRLPRVRFGKAILAPAKWYLRADEIKIDASDPRGQVQCVAETLRAHLGMPRFIGVVEGDNVLAIDLDNHIAVDMLFRMLGKKGSLHLIELALDPDQLCLGSGTDCYTHEIILPLHRRAVASCEISDSNRSNLRSEAAITEIPPSVGLRSVGDGAHRMRVPGSNWLYYRLYGGAGSLDRFLAEELAPLAESMRARGLCREWFYLRFADPNWHIRVRFEGDPVRLTTDVMPCMRKLIEPCVSNGRVQRVDVCTYEREVERYGGLVGLPLCESWFAQESQRIARLLAIVRNENPDWRWQLAAACLVRDLIDFGLNLRQLRRLFTFMARRFLDEFGMCRERLSLIGLKFRKYSTVMVTICSGQLPQDLANSSEISSVLDSSKPQRRMIGDALRSAEARGELPGGVDALLPSLAHMACNRWFAENSRPNEMVLYELIRRGLESLRATGFPEGVYEAEHSKSGSGTCRNGGDSAVTEAMKVSCVHPRQARNAT